MRRFLKSYHFELLLITPLVLYIIGFTYVPIIQTILLSFQNNLTGEWGLSVYRELFAKLDFLRAIFNTFTVTVLALMIQLSAGLLIAMVLKKTFIGKGIVRSLILVPMGVPTLVAGVALIYVFGTQGYLNELLFKLGLIDIPIAWTVGGPTSLLMVAIADSWKVLPIVVILFLAGLESIPSDVYEASSIDGATRLQVFRYITMPLLKPTITMTLLLRAVDLFRIFDLPVVLVGRVTPFLATYAFDEYRVYNNPNASGATSVVLLICILIFMLLYFKYVDKGEAFSNEK